MKNRFYILMAFFSLMFLAVFSRLAFLSISYSPLSSLNSKKSQYRGNIYDSTGRLLASNQPSYSLYSHPDQLIPQQIYQDIPKLAQILNTPQKKLIQKLNLNKKFSWIKRKLSPQIASKIKKLSINGFYLTKESQRFYPYQFLASHVLGFTDIDNHGLEGIEYSFDHLLKPQYSAYKTPRKKTTLYGYDLHLALHYSFQKLSEFVLKNTVLAHQASGGTILIANASTGHILALANYPHYNNNLFTTFLKSYFRNVAISNHFDPGSIFKIFTAAIIIQHQLIDHNQTFRCPSYVFVGQKKITCSTSHGRVNLRQILKKSCNVGIIKASSKIPQKLFLQYLQLLGFGKKTKIGLPGESSGLIQSYFNPFAKSMLSFGYGIDVTPIQIVMAASSIVNGGYLYKPILIQKISSINPSNYPSNLPQNQSFKPFPIKKIFSAQTLKKLTPLLASVLEKGGTGYNASVPKLNIIGKTGTTHSYHVQKRQYLSHQLNTSFVGFVPFKNSYLTIFILIRKASNPINASQIAAPAFKKLVSLFLNYGLIQ